MPGYLVARINVSDWDRYKEYMKVTPGLIEKYGGRFMVRGGESVTLEGPEETYRLVLVEFDSLEKAKEFYHSGEYTQARKLREGAAWVSMIAVEGL